MSKSQQKTTPQTSTRANQVSMLVTKAKAALGTQQYEQVKIILENQYLTTTHRHITI